MKIILLEKIKNLGGIGTAVSVKPGYARNFLIPKGKAVRATASNLARIETERAELEKKEHDTLAKAEARKEALAKLAMITLPAKASEEGKLFGSIGTRDIAIALTKAGVEVNRSEVSLPQGVLRLIGEYEIALQLHTDVATTIKVKVVPAV